MEDSGTVFCIGVVFYMSQATLQESREIIEQRRQEAYEQFELNQWFEEQTDIAERLGYAIDITISYRIKEGKAYCVTDTQDRPFSNQTFLALQRGSANFTGSQAFEAVRLSHEHDEALMVDDLGAGKLNGNVLMKLSRVPDAVVAGTTDIKGYRRDLLRSFVRMYWREDDMVHCRLFTLDQHNQRGIKEVGGLMNINTDQSSEDTLGEYSLVDVPDSPRAFVFGLTESIKKSYDESVLATTGKTTYAGSLWNEQSDAMAAIDGQQRLFRDHMKALRAIRAMGLSQEAEEDLLEIERQRTAAAIKLASRGEVIESSSDMAVSAEVESGDYGRECATPSAENGMNQAQANQNVWRPGKCVVCFRETSIGSCGVCRACEMADNRGVDLLKLRDTNLKKLQKKQAGQTGERRSERMPQSGNERSLEPPKATIETVFAQDGMYFKIDERIGIGGMVQHTKQITYKEWIAQKN